jgi:hypothetical protein
MVRLLLFYFRDRESNTSLTILFGRVLNKQLTLLLYLLYPSGRYSKMKYPFYSLRIGDNDFDV